MLDLLRSAKVPVIMYSHDGFGLGHIRRNYLIARRTVAEIRNSHILLVTGCIVPPFSYLPDGIDFVKLPSIVKVDNGLWRPRTLGIDLRDFQQLRSTFILKCAEIVRPRVVVVDYTPTGVWRELVPALDMLKRRKSPPKIILGLRDILDTPQQIRRLWKSEGAYDVIREYYDKILIYGSREFFDTAGSYGLSDDLANKVTYCGYLCSGGTLDSKRDIRKELGLADCRLILVTAGGGYDAYPMMQLSVKALRHVMKQTRARAVLITGPLMNRESCGALEIQAAGLPIHILKSADTPCYIEAADLVITMAGYNTLLDSVFFKKKIIVIPRNGPSAEQRLRAGLFAKRGLVTALKPAAELTAAELAEITLEKIHTPSIPASHIPLDGLSRTVRQIKAVVSNRPVTAGSLGPAKRRGLATYRSA
ncbi:MAG: glycosyltransferase family protein [Planctomycetota bacterium]|jgi:predicted glycosyltransferase